ncbi:MAG: MotA/TolQ/ExbB proton channel family protein [Desulfovibrionaceae bacterium]
MTQYGFFGLLWESSLVIKVVFVVLFGMSVSTWGLIFAKWWELSRAAREARAVREEVAAAGSLEGARRAASGEGEEPGAAKAVVLAGVEELERLRGVTLPGAERGRLVLENLRHALADAAREQADRLYGSLAFLSTCAAAAPLLGLFGTVWGIMSSFSSITGGAGGVAEVAPGLAEALGTTAAGLVVAIPAVLAYNLHLKMLGAIEAELAALGAAYMNRVKAELDAVAGCGPAPAEGEED